MSKTPDNRRSDSDVWGSPEPGAAAYKENVLAIQDMFLWSLSSVVRNGAVPYLRELPSTGQDPVAMPIHGVTPDAFWNTEAWKAFRHWSNSEAIRFHQGSLGQAWLQPTVLGTNLPLRHLQCSSWWFCLSHPWAQI